MYGINSKIFFLSGRFIFGGSSYIWINTFSRDRHDFLEHRLRFGFVLHWGKYGMIH